MIPARSCLDCGALVRGAGRCTSCKAKRDRAKDQARGGSTARKRWRAAVFARDGGRCVHCGAPATQADHIEPVRRRPDLALVVANGRATCDRCHARLGA